MNITHYTQTIVWRWMSSESDCFLKGEFFRNISNLGIFSNEDLDFEKTWAKEAVLPSYRNNSNNVPQHLYKEDFLALQNHVKIKNFVI